MFKKIFIYGLSFGSVSGAFMFVHYSNGLYTSNGGQLFYILFTLLIIPVTAIIMIVKSMKRDMGATPTAGTIIITGMFTSLVIGLTVTLIYAILLKTNPAIIESAISYSVEILSKKGDSIEQIENYKKQFEIRSQLRINVFAAGSLGLLVSGVIALIFRAPMSTTLSSKKDEKED